MKNLALESIVMCKVGSPKMSESEMLSLAANLPFWKQFNDLDILKLKREFNFKNYKLALLFTNQLANLAETAKHHPAITLEWGKVTVVWWTHTIQGLHRNDFIMAARTEQLFIQVESSKLEQT